MIATNLRRACVLLLAFCAASAARGQIAPQFLGTFAIDLPETVGQKAPLVKWILRCQDSKCALALGNQATQTYDKLEPARAEHLSQARSALKYARDRKSIGKTEAPHLAPLLDSDSDLESCIDLGYAKPSFPGADLPGLTLLCTLQRNPWRRPVVLLLGTLLANCGPAFCRYEIFPLFKE
jgi:hypothetical protein